MSQPAIIVEGISKRYRLGHQASPHQTFREMAMGMLAAPFRKLRSAHEGGAQGEEFWALKDVNFEVQPGEVVGIIGRNGAGKSTLLKILSRITEPTTGQIRMRGRVASLLEVGTGFHPELTGRENIYLNGAILGMKRAEITKKFDEIVAFAETEKFLDTPVKFYSSGMYVRLAFAVAAHLEPEILIVDEVLAVGDAEFQKKCLGKMKEVSAGEGRTVLFVSHNMASVEALCDQCLWLLQGETQTLGPTQLVINRYMAAGVITGAEVDLECHPSREVGSTPLLSALRIVGPNGSPATDLSLGQSLEFQIQLSSKVSGSFPSVGIGINAVQGQRVFTLHTKFAREIPGRFNPSGWVRCKIERLMLSPGQYTLKLALNVGGQDVDVIDPAATFSVMGRDIFGTGNLPNEQQGFVVQDCEWQYD